MVIVCGFLVLSVLVLLIISKVVVELFEVLAKSMAVNFVILKGGLWLYDQSSLLLGHSIMFLRILQAFSSVSVTATKAQSLMKPVESSDLLFALSIKLAL